MDQFWLDGILSRLEGYQNTNSSPGPILGGQVSKKTQIDLFYN